MENKLESAAKGFFSKPEGFTGKIVLVLMAIGAVVGVYYALPYLIILLQNTLYAILLLTGVAVTFFLVTNKSVQNLVSSGFQVLMRGITGIFVELNKLAVIRLHIEYLEKNHSKMDTHIGNLQGEIRGLERKISENKTDIEKSLKIASSAKQQEEKGKAWIAARAAGRRRDGTIKLSDLLAKMKKIHSVLKKMYEVSGYVIEDLKDDVQVKEIEYKSIKHAHATLMASMSILQGNPNERAMFEMALEKMEEEVSQKLGTMDRFMDMSESLVKGIDIEQGIFAEDGMKMLEEYENGGFDSFFNDFGTLQSGESVDSKMDSKESVEDFRNTIKKDAATGKYF